MENLLDYLLYALFGHNVTSVSKFNPLKWVITFENEVSICLDVDDLAVIRNLYDERYERLDDVERARYEKIFSLCV